MNYTDADIPIQCSDCSGEHFEEGLENMIAHIRDKHPNYSIPEAAEFALRWMEESYDILDLQEEKMTKAYRS